MIDHQLQRSNRIFQAIKDFEKLFPEEFEKTNIRKCGHCNGVGFSDSSLQQQCTNCGGMGYVGYKKLMGEFVCRACNGYGCTFCEKKGTVDWISHARGSDMFPDPKRRRAQ